MDVPKDGKYEEIWNSQAVNNIFRQLYIFNLIRVSSRNYSWVQ